MEKSTYSCHGNSEETNYTRFRECLMKRGLLVIAFGIAFLIAITWLGTFIADYIPYRPTPQVQTSSVGSYDVTLRVNPNPPSLDQPATLSVQIQQHASRQPVSNMHVVIDGTMESMDMGTTEVEAKEQGTGLYVARMPFSMSGLWQIQILFSKPGLATLNAVFTVTTQ
jgi:hypothetical protein